MPARREKIVKVIHPARPELGVGEVGELVKGTPPVIQVYWPDVDKWGFYLSTDLRRIEENGAKSSSAT